MKEYKAHFMDRVDGELVTYHQLITTTSKAKAQAGFKAIAKENGWRLVQFYET